MTARPVLINDEWRAADAADTFQAVNPATKESLTDQYPVSSWQDCDAALDAAARAADELRAMPTDTIAGFLAAYADRIEVRKDELVEMAHKETALPVTPRLADVELPRTVTQLRQAAAAARDGSWATPTIDTQTDIRSCFGPIGPVVVFGPNNFPFAFGSISGGDFAAAIAAGNPVIAKAHPLHPGTTRLFAEEALAAARAAGLPAGTVQLLYHMDPADGKRLVADARVGAVGYTGSRTAGLALKAAADAAGIPIFLELSSVNPVVILPGAIAERADALADEFTTSCLMGAGQFCTNPGLLILLANDATEQFITGVAERFEQAPVGTLLGERVEADLNRGLADLRAAGASTVAGDGGGSGAGYSHPNTLLRVDGRSFLDSPTALQVEAFGNASLFVVADDTDQVVDILGHLEGNLTGCIYSNTAGADDDAYDSVARAMRPRVGRLLNDKMPTGVAVTGAMHHGGPYPATGHPGFTAVGMPASLRRFAMLQCYDAVREHRLPPCLRNENPTGSTWRLIDGQWSQGNVG